METDKQPNERIFKYITLFSIIGLGLYRAYKYRWLGDDIFITLRYVKNFLAGKGLVYNLGEYVEGYTHPLWLFVIALFQKIGFEPTQIVIWLGILSYLGVLILIFKLSKNYFAVLALVLNTDVVIWATGGLETMFLTFLLVSAYYVYDKNKLISGFLTGLCVLTRPDTILFVFLANMVLLWKRERQNLAYFNLPIIILLGGFEIWRYYYYGEWLPNTYYAKSGGSFYFSQGFFYLWTYLRVHITTILIFAGLFLRNKKLYFLLAAIFLYAIGFIAKVGGDFMYARFLIPLIPFIYLIIGECIAVKLKHFKYGVIVSLLLIIGVFESWARQDYLIGGKILTFPEGLVKHKVLFHRGIVDERAYYQFTNLDDEKKIGLWLKKVFDGYNIRVFLKCQACLGYYGDFSYCLSNHGLTDKHIARSPIEKRRIGHEKSAPYDYIKQKDIHFYIGRAEKLNSSNREIWIKSNEYLAKIEIITDDNSLLKQLKLIEE